MTGEERPQHVSSTCFWVCSCLLTRWSKPLTNLPGSSNVSAASLFFQKAAISMILKHFPDFKYSCDTVQPSCTQLSARPALAIILSAGPVQAGPLMPCCFWNVGECRVSLLPDRSFVTAGEREPARFGSFSQVHQVCSAIALAFWTRAEKPLGIQAAVVLVFSFIENKFWIGL